MIEDFRDRGEGVHDRGKSPGAPNSFEDIHDEYIRPDFPPLNSLKPSTPFLEALKDTRKVENDKELFETFSNCEVNIPLLKLVKSIPRYAKFLKEMCKMKRKKVVKEKKKVKVSENVSAILQKQFPKKCSDLGMLTIPCKIGGTMFEKVMLDLGASINSLPLSLYDSLEVGPLQNTWIVIQLADNSYVYPKGVVQDVIEEVDKLIFPADFFVMDTGQEQNATPVMLGRSFMNTAQTKIDVRSGLITMEFDGVRVGFNIDDAKRHPPDGDPKCSVDVSNPS